MLDERQVHLLATDAHNLEQRAPRLAEGRDAAAARLGEAEAAHLVLTRPQGILDDIDPGQLLALTPQASARASNAGFWQRLFRVV